MLKLVPATATSEATSGLFGSRFLRPKGNYTTAELRWLLAIGALPLLVMLVRLIALPGLVGYGFEGSILDTVRRLGCTLNETFSLSAVPHDQRGHILYLLFVPTYAILIVLARLTLGIRVLGFRSILVAVGFHQVGILPSLFLMAVVVATVSWVRPWLKKKRLPYYARVSVILSLVVLTMVGALLIAAGIHSAFLWGTAYFPVIVLGMLAEGIVQTLNRDSLVVASWRAVTTVVLAFLMVLLTKIPVALEMALQFPELLLTQIVVIFLIAEYLDLRLLQDWDSKMSGMALPKLLSNQETYRVAVVRNQAGAGIIGRLGRPAPANLAHQSVQKVVDALREVGHTVKVFEGDMSLLGELNQFLGPHPRTGELGGIVLNMAHGIQGNGRHTHVPAMLEMAGVAYTGPTPLGHSAIFDTLVAKTLLQRTGIPTPAFDLLLRSSHELRGLVYPLAVKPRHESSCPALIVHDREQLERAVKRIRHKFRQDALVEEHVQGRQITVALLGNNPVECLPLVEIDPVKKSKICPAPIDEDLAKQIRTYSKLAFWTFGCRDYARVDFRVTESGQLYVIQVRSAGILQSGGSFAAAAQAAGFSHAQLLGHIIEVARARYLENDVIRPIQIAPSFAVRQRRLRKVSGLAGS